MTAERLEIARRFVACPGWVWLEGMADQHGRRVTAVGSNGVPTNWPQVYREGDNALGYSLSWYWNGSHEDPIPNINDPVTAAGILPVVRRAWDDHRAVVWPAHRSPPGMADVWMVYCNGREFSGPSELLALLAALEAAPK